MKWTAILTVAAVLGLWAFEDSLPLKSEITVYLGWCQVPRVQGECRGLEESGVPTTYKAIVDRQNVVYWQPNGVPKKYEHCAARDARNWSCIDKFEDGGSVERAMVDGNFEEVWTGLKSDFQNPYYQVPKWRWQLLDWQTKVNSRATPPTMRP